MFHIYKVLHHIYELSHHIAGRQELILVGGFHSDRNTDIQRSSSESSSVTLNESVYIISGT